MGRRKVKRTAIKKASKAKLETTFACPYCNAEHVVECKIDRANGVGTANCRLCKATFQTTANMLTEPVDIYSEWLDVLEEKEKSRASRAKADANAHVKAEQSSAPAPVTTTEINTSEIERSE